MLSEKLARKSVEQLPALPDSLRQHAEFACDFLQKSPRTIDRVMRKHQLSLADRQCRMSYLSGQIQDAVVILCTRCMRHGRTTKQLETRPTACATTLPAS